MIVDYFVIAILRIVVLCPLAFITGTAVHDLTTTTTTAPVGSSTTLAPLLPTTVEKLIRFRKKPQITIIKHVTRNPLKRSKQRNRVKKPNIKYRRQPSFVHDEGPTLWHRTRYAQHFLQPTAIRIDADTGDFQLPSSAYESQVMDFDLYNNEYASGQDASYDYHVPRDDNDYNTLRRPHQIYGLPAINPPQYNIVLNATGDDVQEGEGEGDGDGDGDDDGGGGGIYQRNVPAYKQPPAMVDDIGYDRESSYREGGPSTATDVFSSIYNGNEHENVQYDDVPSQFGQQQHFAEPPNPSDDIELSPPAFSYDVDLIAKQNNVYRGVKHFAEPPPIDLLQAPTTTATTTMMTMTLTTPIYDDDAYDMEQRPIDFLPTFQELPLNHDYKLPMYDLAKSSYEVPIYGAIPFQIHHAVNDISTRQTVNHVQKQQQQQYDDDDGLQQATVYNKHTLDTPELRQSYADNNQKRPKHTDDGGTTTRISSSSSSSSSSSYINDPIITTIKPATLETNDFMYKAWNPKRIRTTKRPTIKLQEILSNREQKQQQQQQQHIIDNNHNLENITILSIEKSHSHNYYDGTMLPPISDTHLEATSRQTIAQIDRDDDDDNDDDDDDVNNKWIPKNVFDNTHFKSPTNDKELSSSTFVNPVIDLPKNHKLF